MTETIPPTYPSIDTSYFSPRSSPTPAKRLRSCLSPTRTPIGSNTPSRIHGSRAASFSSECSGMTDGRRGSKSVRWEENEECGAVTSFHPTWSAAEYDRTPLEPPSEAERTCVLPPRGSREFTSSYDCFGPHDSVDACEDEDEDAPSSPAEEISHESFVLATPDTPEDEDDEAIVETRQWEECMERRRMMFALRTRIQDQEHQPEFEGYRSLSAKLALMLESIEARREPSPDEEDEEEEEVDEQSEAAETGDSEDEGEMRPCSSFTFTNLQSLHIRSTPLDAIPDEDENSTDADLDGDAETSAPSLISSAESDQDSTLISPQPSVMSFSSPIDGLPYKSVALSLERTATVEVSAAVQ